MIAAARDDLARQDANEIRQERRNANLPDDPQAEAAALKERQEQRAIAIATRIASSSRSGLGPSKRRGRRRTKKDEEDEDADDPIDEEDEQEVDAHLMQQNGEDLFAMPSHLEPEHQHQQPPSRFAHHHQHHHQHHQHHHQEHQEQMANAVAGPSSAVMQAPRTMHAPQRNHDLGIGSSTSSAPAAPYVHLFSGMHPF